MSYTTDLKRFKALLRFVNGRYYKDRETVLNRLEMVLNRLLLMYYVIGSQIYVIIGDMGLKMTTFQFSLNQVCLCNLFQCYCKRLGS